MMEPEWWVVPTEMGKVIFHGADKDRAERVASINGREAIPLVRLSDAEARIAEITEQRDTWTDNDRAKAWRQSFDDMHQRAMAAEVLLKEAREALEPFASGKHEMRNTHLLEWLTEGYGHCKRGSEDWAQSYLNSARDYIKAFEAVARALKEKP